MRFTVKNSNLFLMPGNSHLLHLGTIGYGLREFVAMAAIQGPHKGKCYIEEAVLESKDFNKDVWAHCKFIDDDNLAFDLAKFCEEKGITDIPKRMNELGERGNLSWLAQRGSKT